MRRRLEIEVVGEDAPDTRARGELVRAVFIACWKRRNKALLDQGKNDVEAEQESAKEAEALVNDVFPGLKKWRYRFIFP